VLKVKEIRKLPIDDGDITARDKKSSTHFKAISCPAMSDIGYLLKSDADVTETGKAINV
jgi:hypothetical protein